MPMHTLKPTYFWDTCTFGITNVFYLSAPRIISALRTQAAHENTRSIGLHHGEYGGVNS